MRKINYKENRQFYRNLLIYLVNQIRQVGRLLQENFSSIFPSQLKLKVSIFLLEKGQNQFTRTHIVQSMSEESNTRLTLFNEHVSRIVKTTENLSP